jgi:multidrug resistance efflux pump
MGTITWLIEEGTAVQTGDKLAEFEKTEVEHEIEEEVNDLNQHQIELEAAQAELAIQQRDAAAQVEAAEFELKMVRLKMEKYTKGEGPNEHRKLELAVEKTRSEHERARERFAQIPDLAAQGFYTALEVERERIALREAEINQENAENDLQIWVTYTDPMEREQIEVDLKNAERDLANAREKAQISIKESEARVSHFSGRVLSTEQELEELRQQLESMTVVAPSPGIVHYGDPARPWYRENVQVGNQFHPGNTMFTLPDLHEMQVLVSVHEADIDLVELGQQVLITVESAKGRALTGRVTQIAAVASADWMDEANKTFRVEITMDPLGDVELRAGITARCEIQVETIPGVLQVPIQSVVSEAGKHFCFLPRPAGGYEQREVQIDKNNTHYVVVSHGLEEREQVLLVDPRRESATEAPAPQEAEADAPAPVALSEPSP